MLATIDNHRFPLAVGARLPSWRTEWVVRKLTTYNSLSLQVLLSSYNDCIGYD